MKSRDRLYIVAMVSTFLFSVLTVALMLGFKKNEAFFDSYRYIGTFAENEVVEAIEEKKQEDYNYQYGKRNIEIEVEDKQEGILCIPLKSELSDDNIDVRYEFAKNKFIITLKKQPDIIDSGKKIISDSSIMKAIGAYNIKEDSVIEIFCSDTAKIDCNYEVKDAMLKINFTSIYDTYERTVVLYVPYEQRTILSGYELDKNKNVKIFSCGTLQEDYSSGEVIDFANRIYADMVIGINFNDKSQTSYFKIIYNDRYYIQQFGSTQLAELMNEKVVKRTGIDFAGYKVAEENDILVTNAKVPTIMTEFWIHKEDNSINAVDYDLNHDIMTAIEDIIKDIK